MQLSKAAKEAGLAVAVERGLFQLQKVAYSASGTSTITAVSGWLSAADAMSFMREGCAQ